MEFNEIDTYLHKILKKQLQRLKISNNGLYAILNNVKTQMYSYINNYNDIDFRHALLVTTMEEGKFYEPIINEELGSFVVLTIRNSLLEVIASIDYHEYGLTTAIKDEHIREITSKAIEYFKDVNFINLSKKITVEDDYYRELEKIYPNAFSSLILLGKCTKENPSIQYQPKEMKKYELKELDKDKLNIQKVNKENGYSLNLNDNLIYVLKSIKEGKTNLFYVDSFKYLSRNLEKVLKVLEFILTHDSMFVTNNYLISNGYISRRRNIVRAGHGGEYNYESINTINEVSDINGENLKEALLASVKND